NNGDITGENTDSNRVMELLRDNPAITAALLAEKTGFSTRKISRIMKELRENGMIIRVGSSRKGYWEIVRR
ncbi:MAG: winged helix-turn-helix transcriptional regulator, partial [Eubacteriales bacterium]|nr:winged helix-turn-helix transcriptional regulator [Eubacteriales bacterium]